MPDASAPPNSLDQLRFFHSFASKAADDFADFACRIAAVPAADLKTGAVIADLERRARDGAGSWRLMASIISLQISVIERGR